MKLAGIDGVIVDWYGLTDFRDYAILHHNTTRLLETAERLKMKFVICYEDQTIPALVEAKRISGGGRVSHAVKEISWLGSDWFESPSYLSLDGKAVLLSFGQTGLTDEEWSQCIKTLKSPVLYFSQQHRRMAAVGAFDWPTPTDPLPAIERFRRESVDWPKAIPVAFPRFVDIYAEANVSRSYGRFEDDGGKSFRVMLEAALKSESPIVQIATWNDWGEGTIIEPSHEFGYRDLETAFHLIRQQSRSSNSAAAPAVLRLPARLLELRRSQSTDKDRSILDRISQLLANDELIEARALLQLSAR